MRGNDFIAWMLRSPIHGLISGSMMLVSVTGRKTGQTYTTPVEYVRDGEVLWTISLPTRTWWRNARGGAPVRLHLRGKDRSATAEVVEGEAAPAALARLFALQPRYAKRLGIAPTGSGAPDPAALATVARQHVIVKFSLD